MTRSADPFRPAGPSGPGTPARPGPGQLLWSRRHLLLVTGLTGLTGACALTRFGSGSESATAPGPISSASATAVTGSVGGAAGAGVEVPPLPLLWSADFDGPAGTGVDPSVWTVRTGAGGWGNGELQCYTDHPSNVSVDGRGTLALTMRREDVVDARGDAARFTSGRIESVQTFRATRFEARMRVPMGIGLWSAFWTVGADIDAVGWPRCGEVDVLEHYDTSDSYEVVAHAAQLDASGAPLAGSGWKDRHDVTLPDLAEQFHDYAVDLGPDRLTFSTDGRVTAVVRRADRTPDEEWPFDQAQRLTLNLAMSRWLGDQLPDLPASLEVARVRVYGSGAS